jgi:Ca2+-binding RTX toxin-like protein
VATINGTQNDDILNGTAGDDVVFGHGGNDTIDGGAGADRMDGGAGNDTYVVDSAQDVVEELDGGGYDTITTALAEFNMRFAHVERLFYTGSGAIIVHGNAADNYIRGGAQDDYINGGAGADVMVGLGGNDYYIVDDVNDVVVEEEVEGENWDTVATTLTTYTLGATLEYLIGIGNANFTLTGNAKRNHISSGNGNDVLNGGGGADTMQGWGGDDIYVVDTDQDTIYESPGGGNDTVYTGISAYSIPANVENAIYFGTASGVYFWGNASNNRLQGSAHSDMLDGGAGNDTLVGKGGDDLYRVDDAGDTVVEAANEGIDRIFTSLTTYVLPANIENLHYFGIPAKAFTGTGNALDNSILGHVGDDVLDGGVGADELAGGLGNDTYYVDNVGDTVWDLRNEGYDKVYTTLNYYKLGEHTEAVHFVGPADLPFLGIGNDRDNVLVGGGSDDELDGGLGADAMAGGVGNDHYHVDNAGDVVTEHANEGVIDYVFVRTLTSYALGANVERLVYLGAANFQATGNELANRLITGAGNDSLNGGAGADRMEGKGGNDLYSVDNVNDVIIETEDGGVDSVWATSSAYTLGANVERLLYGGAYNAAFAATGNASDNFIETGEGDDIIDGGAGADEMTGRSGNDVYVVDDFGDVIREFGFGGTDEVRTALGSRTDATKMYVLPGNVENLTGTSAAAQGVYGNSLNNLVRMGAGGDLVVLHDGGDDTVQSGGGNDFIYFGNAFTAADRVDGGAGRDTVGLLGHYELTLGEASLVGVEKLAMYGSGSPFGFHYAIATVDANVDAGKQLMVVAQSLGAHETLSFDGSAETAGSFNVRGGKGGDTIVGGAGGDLFQYRSAAESSGYDYDRILDFAAGDRIDLQVIDADGNPANGNGKFAFIGDAAFGRIAGQLRAVELDGSWLVQGDTNGDGWADLQILVTASPDHILAGADFVL